MGEKRGKSDSIIVLSPLTHPFFVCQSIVDKLNGSVLKYNLYPSELADNARRVVWVMAGGAGW